MVEHQCHVILSKLPCRFTFNYRSSELEWSTFAVALDLKRKLATKSCIASFLDPNLDPKTGRYKISPPLKFTAPASTFKPCSTCVSCSVFFFPAACLVVVVVVVVGVGAAVAVAVAVAFIYSSNSSGAAAGAAVVMRTCT